MADIVQLAENGVLKYLKTHTKAVEGLDKELAKKQDMIKDTGWIKAATVGSNVLYYRRIGDVVFMNGQGDKTLPRTSNALIWAIPLGFRPDLPAAKAESFFTLDNTDSTPTNMTIVRLRIDAITMIYRNNDMGCAFSRVIFPTSDPFPNLITNK